MSTPIKFYGRVGCVGLDDLLGDVTVTLNPTTDATTNANGLYDMTLAAGTLNTSYNIRFSKCGYVTESKTVKPLNQDATEIRTNHVMMPRIINALDQILTLDTSEADTTLYVGGSLGSTHPHAATIIYEKSSGKIVFWCPDPAIVTGENIEMDVLFKAMLVQLNSDIAVYLESLT